MPDLLVNLLKLPPLQTLLDESHHNGIVIRRAQPFEITPVLEFIEEDFSVAWADEISVGFANKPVTVYIATREGRVVGFDIRTQAEEIKRHISYMTQRFSLYKNLSIVENLSFYAGIYGVPWGQRRKRVEQVLEQSGLGERRT